MTRLRILAAVAALSLAFGATSHAQVSQPEAGPPAAAPAPSEAPAGPQASSATTPASAASVGHVIFFRPTRMNGAFYTYHVVEVGEDGKPAKDAPHVGDLSNGGAFAVDVEPGIHAYNITGPMAVNKAEDRLRMEVEPGETYYVEQTVRVGLITSGFRLVPADKARFTASHAKLKPAADTTSHPQP